MDNSNTGDDGVLEAGRAIRPYLSDLVPDQAEIFDTAIAEILNTLGATDVSQLRAILNANEMTSEFLAEVLADRPEYRPPSLQPVNTRSGGYEPLAGNPQPVMHAGKFTCPSGDFVWYRHSVGAPIPICPTHNTHLMRSPNVGS